MRPRQLVTGTLAILSLWVVMALAWPLPSALAGFTPTPRPTTPSVTTPAPTARPPEKEPKDTPTVTQTVDPLTATPALMPQTGGRVATGSEMPAAMLMGIIALVLVVAGMIVHRLSGSGNR